MSGCISLTGLKQFLEEINVSCSRTQTAAVPQVRLEPVTLRSRVEHSTIKPLRSLTNFAPVGIHQSVRRALKLTCADPERFVIGVSNLTSCFINIFN